MSMDEAPTGHEPFARREDIAPIGLKHDKAPIGHSFMQSWILSPLLVARRCSPDRPQTRQGPDWSTSIQVDVDSNFYRRLDTGIGPKAHRYSPDRPQAR